MPFAPAPSAFADIAVTGLTVANTSGASKKFVTAATNYLSLLQADGTTVDFSSDAAGSFIARGDLLAYWGGSTPTKASPAVHPGYISGGAYPLGPQSAAAAAVGGVDIIYLLPFFVASPVTPSAFGMRVVAAGTGSAVKLGIWANNPATMRPTGVPIMSNNAGVATTSASTNVRPAVTGAPLAPGVMYWIGAKHTGTLPTTTMLSGAAATIAILLGLGVGTSTTQPTGLSAPDAYANDISSTSLTSATFTTLTGAAVPLYEMVAT